MLLPAAGLIIAAAPATERRRCRGRPPAVPALSAPAPPCRHSGSHFQATFSYLLFVRSGRATIPRHRLGPPPQSASSERQFDRAIWNSVTKKAVFWLPMGFEESSVTKKGGFWLRMG